jgi:dTDP-4-amino-4,6-dideoxygalactose transaminase
MIPFNKPFLTGNETKYIEEAVKTGKISGNGIFTKRCQEFFEKRYGFKKCLLTTSCTDALEMAAILFDIKPGDEVIMPSYTFVSTALAFVRQGAKIIFADSLSNHPNIDADKIEELITKKTKVIVPVHYAGVACDMDKIMKLSEKYGLYVVEDAAQALDSFYINNVNVKEIEKRPIGTIGHLSTFSFHETKNIISGEGGMLAINDISFIKRAEIIWEKGTNRAEFFRGEINKYGWVDTGSSFLPSEVIAAFLWAQLEKLDDIQERRKAIWDQYYNNLKPKSDTGQFNLPIVHDYASNNAHMFYVICKSLDERTNLISYLRIKGILAVFHYLSLHSSIYYESKHDGRELPNCDMFANCLLRLPLFYEMKDKEVSTICNSIIEFFSISKG